MTAYDNIPDELQERDQWLLWDSSADAPRRPHWNGDFSVSWSDPDEWHSFNDAVALAESRESWGIGYVTALDNPDYGRGLYGVIDVDGGVAERGRPKDWVPDLDQFVDAEAYMEYSPSGDGIHIPIVGQERPEWWKDVQFDENEHEGVDYLTHKFCTFTGDVLEASGRHVADASEIDAQRFFYDAYTAVTGDAPRTGDRVGVGGDGQQSSDEWLDDDAVADALDHINPDVGYAAWRNLAFAVHDYDDTANGRRLFEEWSRRGEKYDADAERTIEHIWNNADAGSGVTVRTLVHEAKQNGWDASTAAKERAEPKRRDGGTEAGAGGGADAENLGPSLDPANVAAWAGLGEDEDVGDLDDREKAAQTWALIQNTDDFHVCVRRENASLWAYDEGVWKPEGERALRRAARQALGAPTFGERTLKELKVQARSDPLAEVEADEFGVEPGTVAVENGLLDLNAAANGAGYDALRDLEPDDYALAKLPVEYNPDASYDEWAEYVDEWAENGWSDALQEYVGYTLQMNDMPIHRALLLVGSGANGKGTFLHVVRSLLGKENTTSIELQTLANERDAVAQFYGSIANIDDDLSARKLGAGLGMFKKLVGGDRVRARRLYETGFEFNATGKHLYAANEVPNVQVPDEDEAFWRRWLLIEFPNHYPPSSRDPTLRDELTTPSALSGVLNWAIEGRHRLLEQGRFTSEEEWAFEKRERWQAWGDSIDMFISEHCDRDESAPNRSTSQVYARYKAWCEKNDHDVAGQQKVTNSLKQENFDYGKKRVKGTSSRAFGALAFSNDVPDPGDRDDGQQSLT